MHGSVPPVPVGPCIRLLIVRSGSAADWIDVSALKSHGIETHFIAPQSLFDLHSIDFDAILVEFAPGFDPLTLIQHVHRLVPACKILLKTHDVDIRTVGYLQSGVTGFLDDAFYQSDRLAGIVRQVCRGEYYLAPEIAQLLAMRQIKRILEPFAALSSREFDVFCMLAEGYKLQTIAEQLGINSKTVSNCQTLIKLKLDLTNRQSLKKFAKTHRLISGESI